MNIDSGAKRRFLRLAVAGAGGLFLSGCDRLSRTAWFTALLAQGERLNYGVHRLFGSRRPMAQEFTEADLSPTFRSNGTRLPANEAYQALASNGFADWALEVSGLVEAPAG